MPCIPGSATTITCRERINIIPSIHPASEPFAPFAKAGAITQLTSASRGRLHLHKLGRIPNNNSSSAHAFMVSTSVATTNDKEWYTDSAASCHMSCHQSWFSEFQDSDSSVILGDDSVVQATGIGTIIMEMHLPDGTLRCTLTGLCANTQKESLLSEWHSGFYQLYSVCHPESTHWLAFSCS